MTNRREFLRLISALSVFPAQAVEAVLQSGKIPTGATKALHKHHQFPVTAQLSPLPGQSTWEKLSARTDAKSIVSAAIDGYIQHGFTGLEYPFKLGSELEEFILEYARKRGLFLTYNHTFDKGGVEIFGRTAPPFVSVYAPEYARAVMEKVAPVLAKAKQLPGLSYLFCYQDEPFHVSATSFDRSAAAQTEFRRRYRYDMPADTEATRENSKQWLDLLNFQSDTFPDGWKQIYKTVKQQLPDVKVILTHDSHSPFGAGVGSNEKLAMDDVFHWGAEFADLIVFDIYPYMMFDFRYGEFGKIRKPRLSQMHFALAQLRNVTYFYGKELGFWFGTFNRKWFKEFMGPELKRESWSEAEICHTAVAHGANYLVSGYKVPEDKAHWDTLGKSLSPLHNAMPELLDCPKVRAKACFIFPRTQYLQLQQEYWNVAVAYEMFQQAFGELDCLHEEQVAKDGLHDYEMVVMFDVELLPEPVARRIADFVNAGGVVIADCVPRMDAFRNPMPLLQELFGVENSPVNRVARTGVFVPKLEKPRWFVEPTAGQDEDLAPGAIVRGNAWGKEFYFRVVSPRSVKVSTSKVLLTSDGGAPALMYRNSGKGHAYLLGFCMQDTCFATSKDEDAASRSALQDLLWSITQQTGVMPSVRSTNPQIEASLRANSTDAFVFVINHEANQPKTQVSVSKPPFVVTAVRSLTDGHDIEYRQVSGRIFFDLEVSRDKPQLLRLTSNT
jgi:hypothetical protein